MTFLPAQVIDTALGTEPDVFFSRESLGLRFMTSINGDRARRTVQAMG
jgi:hypothetical protein